MCEEIRSILDFSFDHNLCFRCPNGSWEPILDIYVSIAFQWYKKFFESIIFDPYNRVLKIRKSIWDSNSHNGSSLGSVRVHSLTLFALLEACDVTLGPPFWPATLQALALVVSSRLGLRKHIWILLRFIFKNFNIFGKKWFIPAFYISKVKISNMFIQKTTNQENAWWCKKMHGSQILFSKNFYHFSKS